MASVAWVHMGIWILLWFQYSVPPNTQVLKAWLLATRHNQWEVNWWWEIWSNQWIWSIDKGLIWLHLLRSQGNFRRMGLTEGRGSLGMLILSLDPSFSLFTSQLPREPLWFIYRCPPPWCSASAHSGPGATELWSETTTVKLCTEINPFPLSWLLRNLVIAAKLKHRHTADPSWSSLQLFLNLSCCS